MTNVVTIPTQLAAEAYVTERAQLCRDILAKGIEALRPRPQSDQPRQPRRPGEICYRCPKPHVISEPDHQPTWPLVRTLTGLPAMPLDSWSPDREAWKAFDQCLDELLELQGESVVWLEAAE